MAKYAPKSKRELQKLVANPAVHLGDIDTSAITDMSALFGGDWETARVHRVDFSGIENWNTSNVKNMRALFSGCQHFNQPIGSWDVSNVENMASMFADCHIFNQALENWNVSKVSDMSAMFLCCYAFNQPLEKWNVAALKNMDNMFLGARSFKQNLNTWHVADKSAMFGKKKSTEKKAEKENKNKEKERNGRFPIFYALQSYFQNGDFKIIQKQLGYNNADKCNVAIKKFASCKELNDWLRTGHFDFRHTNLSFLEKCKEIVAQGFIQNTTLENFELEIKKANVELQNWRDFMHSYIRIQTDFRRTTQPLFALGFSTGMLYAPIPLEDEYLEKGIAACLTKIPEVVRSHYKRHEGRLGYPFTSNILGYSLCLREGDKGTFYYYDTDGNRTEKPNPKDTYPRASFSVDNQTISGNMEEKSPDNPKPSENPSD